MVTPPVSSALGRAFQNCNASLRLLLSQKCISLGLAFHYRYAIMHVRLGRGLCFCFSPFKRSVTLIISRISKWRWKNSPAQPIDTPLVQCNYILTPSKSTFSKRKTCTLVRDEWEPCNMAGNYRASGGWRESQPCPLYLNFHIHTLHNHNEPDRPENLACQCVFYGVLYEH